MIRRSVRSLAMLGSSIALLIATALPAAAVTTIGANISTDGILTVGTGASGFVFGTGVNATTFSSGATAARAISFPDLTGVVALTTNNLGAFAATTSAQFAGVISDETGTGALVLATGPSLVGFTATGNVTMSNATIMDVAPFSFEGVTVDAFDTSFIITDPTANRTVTFPDLSGTVTLLGNATTGTGNLVLASGATLSGLTLSLDDTDSVFNLSLASTSTMTAGRTLTLDVNDAARALSLSGDLTLGGDFILSGASSLTLATTAATSLTLPTTGTLATRLGAETFSNKTFRGDTVFEAPAAALTDDQLGFAPVADGNGARFAGMFVNMVDLTAPRSYGLQNASGTVALGSLANSLFFTTTGATSVTLPTTGTLLADTSTLNGANLGAGTVLATKLQAAAADLGPANVAVDLSNSNGSFATSLTVDGSMTVGSGLSLTGNLQIFGSGTSALQLGGSTAPVHLASFQLTPPGGAGGTAGTAVLLPGSTDTKGQLTVSPTAAGTVDVTFTEQYQTRAPICVISPASDNAASNTQQVFATSTQQKLTLNFATPVTQAQVWNYICVE